MVFVIDFALNYTFKVQNEVQSMHWYNDQCTLLYIFATREKTVSYIRNQHSIFEKIKRMIRYLLNIVLSFTTQIYRPWVLTFIAIGSGLMVLPRNLRRLGPSTSFQGKEIIHMIGTYNWKSILVILHSTSSIALVSYQYKYYMKVIKNVCIKYN